MNLLQCTTFQVPLDEPQVATLLAELFEGVGAQSYLVILPDGEAFPCDSSEIGRHLERQRTVKASLGDGSASCAKRIADATKNFLSIDLPLDSLSVFLSPASGLTPIHYDQAAVLVLQLKGRKVLGVQQNPYIQFPTDDALIGDQSTPMDDWYTLGAGDGVYIPPGHLHTTRTDLFSMTLGIGLKWTPALLHSPGGCPAGQTRRNT